MCDYGGEEESEDESDYSDDYSDEESSDVDSQDSLSEAGLSWDELEKAAADDDRKFGAANKVAPGKGFSKDKGQQSRSKGGGRR